MTEQQIKWAEGHDWYVDKSADMDAVLVRETAITAEGELLSGLRWFDDYRELREWAGY